jgi:hypothetical protein
MPIMLESDTASKDGESQDYRGTLRDNGRGYRLEFYPYARSASRSGLKSAYDGTTNASL